MVSFLRQLFADGVVRVGDPDEPINTQRDAALDCLKEAELLYRADFPGEPPKLDERVALWAAELFYRACQLVVHRELGKANIIAAFADPCPGPLTASAHYSVDLTWQFVSDLYRLSGHIAPGDPLLNAIEQFVQAWPLSSVGVSQAPVALSSEIAAHPGLLQLYVDRILAARQLSRLDDPRVRVAAQAALGLHAHLAPDLASALRIEPTA